jgi:hypothetical protein
VLACGGGSTHPVTTVAPAAGAAPATPSAPSAPVLARFTCGDPDGELHKLALYADQVSPGAALLFQQDDLLRVVGEVIGSPGLAGVDLARPLHMIWLRDRTETRAVVVVAVDERALRPSLQPATHAIVERGVAVLGREDDVAAAAPAALAAYAHAVPAALVGTVDATRLDAEGRGELFMMANAFAIQALGETAMPATEKALAMFGQLERIDGALAIDRDRVELVAELRPTAGGALAAFVAAQRATDYGFAAALGPTRFPLVMAGALAWGPLEDVVAAAVANATGAPLAALTPISGWLVAGAELGGERRATAVVKQAPVDLAARLGDLARPPDGGKPARVAGGGRRGASYHLASAGRDELNAIGAGAGTAWLVLGPRPAGQRWLAGAARGAPAPVLGQALDASRALGESATVAIDLAGRDAATPPAARAPEARALALGLGFAGGLIRMRATIPALQLARALR